MNPERHSQISKLYQAVRELPPDGRDAFLTEACGSDKALREEVDSLLAQPTDAVWLDRPALEVAAQALAGTESKSWVGRTVHHYKVLSLLGAGGMGAVYRAHDNRLDRDVAIKVLPVVYSTSPQWLERFDQEARAAGRLNHPNILTVYDVGVHDDAPYIVMELLEGKELRVLLRQGSISQRRAVDYAQQIAGGLAAAHAKGIVHRDLKPENIFVTKDGRVKILDFGLAKLTPMSPGTSADTGDSGDAPKPGLHPMMGTVGYMSPEQIRGLEADHRSDIFVFGVILYEMLSGRVPFHGTSTLEVSNAILISELPDSTETDLGLPAALGRILRRCMEKAPELRFQSATDLCFALDMLSLPPSPADKVADTASPFSRYPQWMKWGAALAAVLLLATAVGLQYSRSTEDPWTPMFARANFTRLTDFEGKEWDATISRDGKFAAFLSDQDGREDAWITQVGSNVFSNRTSGGAPELGSNPRVRNLAFSPDGIQLTLWVKLWVNSQSHINAWAVPTVGGSIHPFMDDTIEPSWSSDGNRVVYHNDGHGDPIFIAQAGEKVREVFRAEEGIHCHFPVWSPDGKFIYFVKGRPPDEMDIWRIPSAGGKPERITSHNSLVAYPVPLDNRLLLYIAKAEDGSGPWLYGVDVDRRVSSRVSNFGLEQFKSISGSANGKRLVATLADPVATLWQMPISGTEVDDSGAKRIRLPNTQALSPRLSHDDLFYLSSLSGDDRLWKRPLSGGNPTELRSGSSDLGRVLTGPAIAPDGKRIAFTAQKNGQTKLYVMNSDGTGEQPLAVSFKIRGAPTWSPDGKWITLGAENGTVIRVIKIPTDGGPPVPLVQEYSTNPVWSPDGSLVAYSGTEVGTTFHVYVVTADGKPYPLKEDLILPRGAGRFAFMPGKAPTLIVLMGESHKNFWSVELRTGAKRQLTKFGPEFDITDFDVTADGKEIVFGGQKDNSDIALIDLPER